MDSDTVLQIALIGLIWRTILTGIVIFVLFAGDPDIIDGLVSVLMGLGS